MSEICGFCFFLSFGERSSLTLFGGGGGVCVCAYVCVFLSRERRKENTWIHSSYLFCHKFPVCLLTPEQNPQQNALLAVSPVTPTCLSPFFIRDTSRGKGTWGVGRLSLLPPHHVLMFSVFVVAGPQAQDLIVSDRDTGSSDPFAIFKVAGQEKRSRTIARNLNPKWEETFDFCVSSSG